MEEGKIDARGDLKSKIPTKQMHNSVTTMLSAAGFRLEFVTKNEAVLSDLSMLLNFMRFQGRKITLRFLLWNKELEEGY